MTLLGMGWLTNREVQSGCGELEGTPRMSTQDNAGPSCIQGNQALCLFATRSRSNNKGKQLAGKKGSEESKNDNFPLIGGQLTRNHRRLPCPFRIRYPGMCECKSLKDWQRLREHLVMRTHHARIQCPNCGEAFTNSDNWDRHTRAQECTSKLSEVLKNLIWVTTDQDVKIRALKRQGRRTSKSDEELWRDVWDILFEGEHCEEWPYSNNVYVDNFGEKSHTVLVDEEFQKMVSELPGMEHVPEKDRGCLAMQWYLRVHGYFNSAANQVPVAGWPGDDERVQHDKAASSGVQTPQFSASDMHFAAARHGPPGNSLSDSYYPDEETDLSQTALSSFTSDCSQGSLEHFEPASAGPQLGESGHNLGSNPLNFHASLLEPTHAQPAQPSLLIDSSIRPPTTSTGLASDLGKHQKAMAALLNSSQGQYVATNDIGLAGDPFDNWPDLFFNSDLYIPVSNDWYGEES